VKKEKNVAIRSSAEEFLVFSTQSKQDSIEVRYANETLWMTQKMMAELFTCSVDNISLHLKNVFSAGELDEKAVVEDFSVTASDGKKYRTKLYNLDAIISVGYRVNSVRATQFRRWATQVLRKYTIEGYVLDKQRMEQGAFFDEDYFEHVLEDIREIRLSERRFYQKITDIYATSFDYDKDSPLTKKFFAKVQNKMHYAVSKQTAAEIIYNRADSNRPKMGLTSWRQGPSGKIAKTDVSVAKNYLTQEEIRDLGSIVTAFLELAETRAKKHIPMTMQDWADRIDKFLLGDDRDILKDAGKISMAIAKDHAESEYEKYRIVQDRLFSSDFDKLVLQMKKKKM
jgi:hypothetical protein